MFTIEDGRKQFYQWDSNRRLIVADSAINEVHFSNRTDDSSLVCETFVENGITLVNVPNILLQNSWRIHVYAFDKEYTKHEDCYEVIARAKPADYVYTETEVMNWNTISEKVKSLEADTSTLMDIKANKDEVYTKTEIDSKVSSVYKYKGTVPSPMLLPDTKEVGDVYNTTFAGYVYSVSDRNFALTGISSSDGESIGMDSEITLTFDKNISEIGSVGFVGTGADIAFWFDSSRFFIGKVISYSANSIVVKMANLDIANTGYYQNPVLDSVQYIFSHFTAPIPIELIRYFAAIEFDFRYEYIPRGGNVAYDGSGGGNNGWDSLGSTIDTSNFATKNELDNKTSYATQSNKGTVRIWTTIENNETVLNIATED